MLKRPSSRRRSQSSEITLNLIPILDTLVTLIAFLLFASGLAIVLIDSPLPLLAPADEQLEKLKDKPLQLTAIIQESKILIQDWSGSREAHTIENVTDPNTGESRYDLEKLHQTLVGIKSRHPNEVKLILKPAPGVAYEILVTIMDSARRLEKTDTPMYKKNAQGVDEPETKLFPEIIFGNVMS